MYTSRRVSPRIEVLGQLHGQVVAYQASLVVRDISEGGFGVDSDIPFPVGSVQQFKFTTSDRQVVFVTARVLHRRDTTLRDGRPGFSIGLAFESDRATRDGVDKLIDAATSIIEFQ